MINYLEKYNQLPDAVRKKISSPQIMGAIVELEKEYEISLATVVMRVMIKEISVIDLPKFFVFEYSMDARQAERLVDELKDRVFFEVGDFLNFSLDDETSSGIQGGGLNDWMDNRKKDTAVRSSTFFFSPEDEEEVKNLTTRIKNYQEEVEKPVDNSFGVIEKVVSQMRIKQSSEDLDKRFRAILQTYLKGIRNKVDTKQTLIKPIKDGGLGMDGIFVDNVLLITDKINNDMGGAAIPAKPLKKINLPEDISKDAEKKDAGLADSLKQNETRDAPYNFKELEKDKSKEAEEKKKIQSTDEKQEIPKKEKDKPGAEPLAEKADRPPATKQFAPALPAMSNIRQAPSPEGKVRMDDVKYVPKLTGPVDELKELSLVNFRRLSEDPEAAAKNIEQKIGFLEEESYSRRLAGIEAWRQSPINKLYLRVGEDSINLKKSVSDIIREQTKEGGDGLSLPEFEAIMELNKKLRF